MCVFAITSLVRTGSTSLSPSQPQLLSNDGRVLHWAPSSWMSYITDVASNIAIPFIEACAGEVYTPLLDHALGEYFLHADGYFMTYWLALVPYDAGITAYECVLLQGYIIAVA